MSRQVDQILRDQIGGLVIDNAAKQSMIEHLQEELDGLKKSNASELGSKAGRLEGNDADSKPSNKSTSK